MKSYFKEGELVQLNKDLSNKPTMMVFKIIKKKSTEATTPFNSLIGIECIWFTTNGFIQHDEFNFKDLESLEPEEESFNE